MPRNFNKYQYETSPRKLEPEYTPIKNPYKNVIIKIPLLFMINSLKLKSFFITMQYIL